MLNLELFKSNNKKKIRKISLFSFRKYKISIMKASFFWRFGSKTQHQDRLLKLEMTTRLAFKNQTYCPTPLYLLFCLYKIPHLFPHPKEETYSSEYITSWFERGGKKKLAWKGCVIQWAINVLPKLASAVCHNYLQNSVWVPVSVLCFWKKCWSQLWELPKSLNKKCTRHSLIPFISDV